MSSLSSQTNNCSLSKHHKYYISGGDLHILIGTIRFRVHSYFLIRESNYWKDLMAGPISPGDRSTAPGRSESTAIILPDITVAEFESFLWMFYNECYSIYQTTSDNWKAILRLSALWGFHEIRRVALDHLQLVPMEDAVRIRLYIDHNVPQKYLHKYYSKLALREHMLTIEEFRLLDSESIRLVVTAREMLRAPPAQLGNEILSPVRDGLTQGDIDRVFTTVFSPIEDPNSSGNLVSISTLERGISEISLETNCPEEEEEEEVEDHEWVSEEGSSDWGEVGYTTDSEDPDVTVRGSFSL